jgi:hypothetical protein
LKEARNSRRLSRESACPYHFFNSFLLPISFELKERREKKEEEKGSEPREKGLYIRYTRLYGHNDMLKARARKTERQSDRQTEKEREIEG